MAVEGEGRRWHGNTHQAAKTRARARSITATGWHLYPYGWSEATETPDETRSEIETLWAGFSRAGTDDPAQNENAA